MTPKAEAILSYIYQYLKAHHHAPTVTEIAKASYINSRGTVGRYLKQLATEGYITLQPGAHRNIQLTHKAEKLYQHTPCNMEATSIPLLGKIAAGRPIEAVLNQERVDFSFFVSEGNYALKVVGDSMIDEGIHDGDLVVCRYSKTAKNGDIVVALVNQQFTTLKEFYHDSIRHSVILKPANSHMEPMTYPADQIEIQGIMVGLLRMMRQAV